MFQYPRRQNASIPPDQNMTQRTKCFNTPILYTTVVMFDTLETGNSQNWRMAVF